MATDKQDTNASTARDELREHAGKVREDLGELTRLAREAARDEVERLRETASTSVAKGKEKAGDVRDALDEKVSDKPLSSVALALGAGLLVGFLCGRRDN